MTGVKAGPYAGLMTRHHPRRPVSSAFALLAAALFAGSASLAALAQDTSLRDERVVDFAFGKAARLDAKVGPVQIQTVEFLDRGTGSGGGGFAGRFGGRGTDSDASTLVRAHFLAENPSADEWEVSFTLEFLDKSGKLVERVTKRSTWEGEAKPYDLDHPLLTYVVPMVARVRIKMEGRLD